MNTRTARYEDGDRDKSGSFRNPREADSVLKGPRTSRSRGVRERGGGGLVEALTGGSHGEAEICAAAGGKREVGRYYYYTR